MITLHNNGTNLLNHKIFVSYNSQISQYSVSEEELNLEVLKILHSSFDAERLKHLVNRGFFTKNALPAIGQILDKLCIYIYIIMYIPNVISNWKLRSLNIGKYLLTLC